MDHNSDKPEKIGESLQRIPFFSGLSSDVLAAIAAKLRHERYHHGEIVFVEGSLGDSLYLIESGQVRISVGSGSGEKIINYLGPGNFFGEMDLTGTRLDSKVARESSDSQGRVTKYFRDEWLSIKTKLFDGNMLRFAAITREKVRQGYWKRGTISGKMKRKPEKHKGTLQEVRVRLSVNPELYIAPEGGPLAPDLSAYYSGSDVSEGDLLGLLRSVYDLLGRRTSK